MVAARVRFARETCRRSAAVGETQSGFTLIEVLIAATVLAVGMLGAAAILVQSLQANRFAMQRSHAATLAADMAERIRADPAGATAFALDAATTLPAPLLSCLAPNACVAADLAAAELYAWQQTLLATLPDARASIAVATAGSPGSNIFTITVSWTQAGDDGPASFALSVQA